MIYIKLLDNEKKAIAENGANPGLVISIIENFIDDSNLKAGVRELDPNATEFLCRYLFPNLPVDGLFDRILAILNKIDPTGARLDNYYAQENENLKKSADILRRPLGVSIYSASNTDTPNLGLWSMFGSGYTAQYQGVKLQFDEQVIGGDGDCAFHATGFDRNQVVDQLITLKDDVSIRNKFNLEMRSFYISACHDLASRSSLYFCTLNAIPLIRLYAQKIQLDDKMSAVAGDVLSENPDLEKKRYNLRDNFKEFPDSLSKSNWVNLKNEIDEVENKITNEILNPDTYVKYLEENRKNGQSVTANALVEYARINRINLCVWKKIRPESNSLCIESLAGDVVAKDTIHLFFNNSHFNRLNPKILQSDQTQDFGQSSSSTRPSFSTHD